MEQKNYGYVRVQDIMSHGQSLKGEKNTVFSKSVSAGDIRQGLLGDCYLLSAMSVVAHSRPSLLKKIFHPDSRVYRQDGIYTLMFYSGRIPNPVTIDDRFCTV